MSLEENSFIETDSQYGSGLCLNEYKGEISVCNAHKGSDGTVYLEWIYPQTKDRQPSKKTLPWKIGLGELKQAAKYLRYLAGILDQPKTPAKQAPNKPADKKDDAPF